MCDRAECMDERVRAAYRDARQVAIDREKAGASADSIDAAIEMATALYMAIDGPAADCASHRVDWRALALAQRPVVEAAVMDRDAHRAYHVAVEAYESSARSDGDWRGLIAAAKHLTAARSGLHEAVDTYRTRKP